MGTHKYFNAPPERDIGWMDDAACAGYPTDWWFPTRGELGGKGVTLNGTDHSLEALRICATCPVADECLEWGLHERFGIFGGHTGNQRRHLISQRERKRFTVASSGHRSEAGQRIGDPTMHIVKPHHKATAVGESTEDNHGANNNPRQIQGDRIA